MKLAVCMKENIELGICVVKEDKVLPISGLVGIQDLTMTALIEKWSEYVEKIESSDVNDGYSIDEIVFMSPIRLPRRNVICVGKNYLEHAKELEGKTASIAGVPEHPIFFSKLVDESIGPNDVITFSSKVTNEVDYEVELAVIIGKKIKDISASEAESAIFGYTIGNDVSARNLQISHVQWHKGKSLDTFMPLGPVVMTRDSFDYPPKLKIECEINGEVRQSDYTDNLIFSLSEIIATLSEGMTLLPGDIILTGTPSGVGMGFNPPKYLQNGDIVICRIEGIGELKNSVVINN